MFEAPRIVSELREHNGAPAMDTLRELVARKRLALEQRGEIVGDGRPRAHAGSSPSKRLS
jgi:hypothetical protein